MKQAYRNAGLGLLVASSLLTGCSSGVPATQCANGVYRGESYPNSDGEYATIEFEVQDSKVISVKFTVIDDTGKPHDSNYGKSADGSTGDDSYTRAQKAVSAEDEYAKQFAEVGDADKVDSIAGASISHDLFKEAVNNATESCR